MFTDIENMTGRPARDFKGGAWRKSTYSNPSGNCVETAELQDNHVGVRDSTDPTGPVLVFGPGNWRQFVDSVKAGVIG